MKDSECLKRNQQKYKLWEKAKYMLKQGKLKIPNTISDIFDIGNFDDYLIIIDEIKTLLQNRRSR
jgi:hypothetical protein